MRLWGLQLGLNFLWSPAFFAAQMPLLALAVILCLWLTLLVFLRNLWRAERFLALLTLPYVAWVTFATALNAAIVFLN
jgi:tryptophan-rich sensory protein